MSQENSFNQASTETETGNVDNARYLCCRQGCRCECHISGSDCGLCNITVSEVMEFRAPRSKRQQAVGSPVLAEFDSLRAQVARLGEALKPFREAFVEWRDKPELGGPHNKPTYQDFQAAFFALTPSTLALAEEARKGREDTARLDWWINHNCECELSQHGELWDLHDFSNDGLPRSMGRGATPRAAIDAAKGGERA